MARVKLAATSRSLGAWLGFALLAPACHQGDRRSERGASSAGEEQVASVSCGNVRCAPGEVCCNPSCGICAPPHGMCTQQFCDVPADAEAAPGAPGAPGAPDAARPSCDRMRCAAGTHCELVAVQCIRAPCDPVPQCRPD